MQATVARSQQARKTVTIVFSDLVDSTALGEALDAESLNEVMDRYFDATRTVIERHGGVVEKFIGDAVMAVFGLPRMHEDDALRAVRAAAEMRTTLAQLNGDLGVTRGVKLVSRTGVNTGVVVVGDAADGQRLATGDAVNVAARLEQAALPEGIVLGPMTFRLVRRFVSAESIGLLQLKGKSEQIEAYQFIGLSLDDRFGSIPPIVGRGAELALVESRLRAAADERTIETVLIVGEPGVGKSRLASEAVEILARQARVLSAACRPYGTTSFWPISQLLSSAAGVDRPLDRVTLQRLVAETPAGDRAAIADRVASLLGLGDSGFPLRECFWATARLFQSLAQGQRLVLAIEDLHWGEDTLLDLLDHIRMSGQSVGTLILATARPEVLERRWSGDALWHLKVLALQALSPADSNELIDAVLGPAELPASARALIWEAAEGNPLFLEQALSGWIEEGVLARGDRGWVVTRPVTQVRVPDTIMAIFASRLDRLTDSDRSVLGAAAVVGPTVRRRALRSMLTQLDASELDTCLVRLMGLGFLLPTGDDATETERLTFTHASLRDVAYSMMLKSDRASLHERFAGWRESIDEDSQKDEAIGYHLAEAHRYRTELRLLDAHTRELALRSARHLVSECQRTIGIGDRPASERHIGDIVELLTVCGPDSGASDLALIEKAAKLLLTMGRWLDAVALLAPYEGVGHGPLLRDVGVALCQLHRTERHSPEYRKGQRLLETAGQPPYRDTDALASLAGTWKGVDDVRAHALYRQCLEIDPADPYALGNVLEYESTTSGGLLLTTDLLAQIDLASERCQSQANAGANLPWALFDAGKFALLLGDPMKAMSAYAKAAYLASADHMLSTSLASLERFQGTGVEGVAWPKTLLALTRAVRFPSPSSLAGLIGTTTIADVHERTSVVMLAGGTNETAEGWLSRHGQTLEAAFEGFEGVIVSGGTDGGVSGLAGAIRQTHGSRARVIGYLPSQLPENTAVDSRYDELRRTPDTDFTIGQALQAWADLVASGVRPADVKMLAINGGPIAGAEYRVALALGCGVGVIAGSGREADLLLEDPAWVAAPHLHRLDLDVATISQFVSHDRT